MLALGKWPIEQGKPLPPHASSDAEVLCWQDSATPLSIAQFGSKAAPGYRLRMNSDLAVDVSPDGCIVTRLNAPVPQETIDHFLADQVIPRLMAHQGAFVFHGGAVRVGGGALVFLGLSGRGKSTLVASFDQAGFELLGDDAMVLSLTDGAPKVGPVYPSLRLFPDSIAALMPDAVAVGPVAHFTSKQRIDVLIDGDAGEAPIPIRAIFALASPGDKGAIDVCRIAPAEACMALVESSFTLDPADLDQARLRLRDASALASLVPAFKIAYPRDFARLPEIRQAILDQTAALATA